MIPEELFSNSTSNLAQMFSHSSSVSLTFFDGKIDASDIEIPEDGISNKSKLETVNPEVIVKRENKDKFHYQFSDSKLILYADFDEKIYEILELNQDNSKKIFLAYEGKYYQLESSKMDITPLKEVSDKHLINILSAYQKRK